MVVVVDVVVVVVVVVEVVVGGHCWSAHGQRVFRFTRMYGDTHPYLRVSGTRQGK